MALAGELGRLAMISMIAPGDVVPFTDAWFLLVVVLGSWLARMFSFMPGTAVETWPGVVTAPGADTWKVSGTRAGAPWMR